MVSGSGRRRDAIALIGALVVLSALIWTMWAVRTSDSPATTATEYGAYLAAATLAVTLLAFLSKWWWKGRQATAAPTTAAQTIAAADQLADRMLSTWRQEAAERRISTPAPVRVEWRWGPQDIAPPLEHLTTGPAAGAGPLPLPTLDSAQPGADQPGVLLEDGVVTQLHDEVYCQLLHGRLVLVGERGAGKTGAMILLLLATLEQRLMVPEGQRDEVPVPVWLTLGGWDPTTQGLHEWAAATMYRDHPYLRAPDYGPDAAGELLRAGRVALFLDGLDEMAPAAQRRALARITQEGAGLRIVLSSRPTEYRHAIAEGQLHNAAVIALQPVDPQPARDYLCHDRVGTRHDQWAQVGDYLTQHPDSVAARTLNTPLTLSLARETYQDKDPTPLTDSARFPTVADLRAHLFERLLIVAYPDEHRRAHATRWLAWMAHHMGSNRDLAWWHIPTWIPRRQLRLTAGLVFGLAAGLVVGLVVGPVEELVHGLANGLLVGPVTGLVIGLTNGGNGPANGPLVGPVAGLVYGVMAGIAGGLVFRLVGEPKALFPRWPHRGELLGLLVGGLMFGFGGGLVGGLGIGLLVGVADGFVYGLEAGIEEGLEAGLAVGPAVGPVFGLAGWIMRLLELWTVPLPRSTTATPITTYRIDRRTSTVLGLSVGVGLAVAVGLAVGLVAGGGLPVRAGVGGGLAFGLGGGLMAGGLAGGSVPKVGLTELVLGVRGTGRVRFINVLEDAHQRQVLRQAGALYQFRHAELQEYLTNIHQQPSQPPAHS